MTKEEFLQRLRATPRDWFIDNIGCIRRDGVRRDGVYQRQCPISSLRNQPCLDAFDTACVLGIAQADEIVAAADEATWHDPVLRMQLMEACGLES